MGRGHLEVGRVSELLPVLSIPEMSSWEGNNPLFIIESQQCFIASPTHQLLLGTLPLDYPHPKRTGNAVPTVGDASLWNTKEFYNMFSFSLQNRIGCIFLKWDTLQEKLTYYKPITYFQFQYLQVKHNV